VACRVVSRFQNTLEHNVGQLSKSRDGQLRRGGHREENALLQQGAFRRCDPGKNQKGRPLLRHFERRRVIDNLQLQFAEAIGPELENDDCCGDSDDREEDERDHIGAEQIIGRAADRHS